MNTQNEIINDWRERRDLTLAVKKRVEHQLRVLNIEIVPDEGPDADRRRRIEDLRFELSQLREACGDAEQMYLTYSMSSQSNGDEG